MSSSSYNTPSSPDDTPVSPQKNSNAAFFQTLIQAATKAAPELSRKK